MGCVLTFGVGLNISEQYVTRNMNQGKPTTLVTSKNRNRNRNMSSNATGAKETVPAVPTGSRNRSTSVNSLKPKCGVCSMTWTACKCDAKTATESLSSLLKSVQGNGSSAHHMTHLHIMVWLPYRRWMARMNSESFTGDCFAGFEGWRSAWVRPVQEMPYKIAGFIEVLLPVDLVFHDGTAMRAYCSRNGQLIGIVGVNGPDRGVHRDVPYPPHQVDILDVSKCLTWEEIESGRRGVVHGSTTSKNNMRKVVSIVDRIGDEYKVRLIPASEYDEIRMEMLGCEVVQIYAPQLVEEFLFRNKNLLTKSVVKASKPYLESLFKNAIRSDKASIEICHGFERGADRFVEIAYDMSSAIRMLSSEVLPSNQIE